MSRQIYTIGFTKKTAQRFFELLKNNNVELMLDIRLNNTSQLAGFAKYPDIKYFLHVISDIEYVHDSTFSPSEATLKKYKKKEIEWQHYVEEFNQTMVKREIREYIQANYAIEKRICLLCSESMADQCHRRLVSNEFKKVFSDLEIVHL